MINESIKLSDCCGEMEQGDKLCSKCGKPSQFQWYRFFEVKTDSKDESLAEKGSEL